MPDDFPDVLRTFTGLYQLLPWNKDNFDDDGSDNQFDPAIFAKPGNWANGIDKDRLKYGFGWGKRIDTSFFNDRTTIILGDQMMAGAVAFDANGVARNRPTSSRRRDDHRRQRPAKRRAHVPHARRRTRDATHV